MTQASKTLPKPLDQRRAAHAWEAVRKAKAQDGAHNGQNAKKFGGQAKKLPIRIISSGLGQSLAFLMAKKYAPGLLHELSDWVATKGLAAAAGTHPPDLLERILQADSDFLRQATDEVLAYLQWLNRFAEAEGLTDEEDNS